jgi:hypothetical protein
MFSGRSGRVYRLLLLCSLTEIVLKSGGSSIKHRVAVVYESVLVLLNIWMVLISYLGLEMGILTDILVVFLSPSRPTQE